MTTPRICDTCSSQLFNLFRFGFCARAIPRQIQRPYLRSQRLVISLVRTFSVRNQVDADVRPNDFEQVSHTVAKTRRTFGDTLPKGFLSSEEYKIYQRLYGPPLGITKPQDVAYIQDLMRANSENQAQDAGGNDIFREDEDGNLEKVGNVPRPAPNPEKEEVADTEFTEAMEGHNGAQLAGDTMLDDDFQERFDTYVEEVIASGVMSEPTSATGEVSYGDKA
ncbi:MAG: hypothetical protein L6R36_005022, partial [Xanthoria steineri]